jgi:hypothetical protein
LKIFGLQFFGPVRLLADQPGFKNQRSGLGLEHDRETKAPEDATADAKIVSNARGSAAVRVTDKEAATRVLVLSVG